MIHTGAFDRLIKFFPSILANLKDNTHADEMQQAMNLLRFVFYSIAASV